MTTPQSQSRTFVLITPIREHEPYLAASSAYRRAAYFVNAYPPKCSTSLSGKRPFPQNTKPTSVGAMRWGDSLASRATISPSASPVAWPGQGRRNLDKSDHGKHVRTMLKIVPSLSFTSILFGQVLKIFFPWNIIFASLNSGALNELKSWVSWS